MEVYCDKNLAIVKSASIIKSNNAFTVCTVSTTMSHSSFTLTEATLSDLVFMLRTQRNTQFTFKWGICYS